MTAESMVAIDGARFVYPGGNGFELIIPSLAIKQGERIACIGPSGIGKTTLVNLIAGILQPETGQVKVDGTEVSAMPDAARRAMRIGTIGMVFQEFELLDYLSALDNILLPFHVSGELKLTPDVRQRAEQVAAATGITHVLNRRPRHLSQGERQRVAICRALITQPSLILCDEPTGNLDPDTAEATLDLLFDQVAKCGATMLMVTHNHAILDRFDRVIDLGELASPEASA